MLKDAIDLGEARRQIDNAESDDLRPLANQLLREIEAWRSFWNETTANVPLRPSKAPSYRPSRLSTEHMLAVKWRNRVYRVSCPAAVNSEPKIPQAILANADAILRLDAEAIAAGRAWIKNLNEEDGEEMFRQAMRSNLTHHVAQLVDEFKLRSG